MMRRMLGLVAVAALAMPTPMLAQQHEVTGIVVKVDRARGSMVVSCNEVPGSMAAMEMPFTVTDVKQLRDIRAGSSVRFVMEQRGRVLYARRIAATIAENLEPEPMQAGALSALQAAVGPASGMKVVAQGQHVPDFELTNQAQKRVKLSDFQGKVVLLTFGYSRCPNPDYCVRLANNLSGVRERFAARSGRDLVLMTIAIDPEHDSGKALAEYAAVWKADPANWHFLTGPLPEIKRVAGMFGMNFWQAEGLLTHTLHTVVIDRSGDVAANLDGNQFTVRQLGDLVQTVMDRPH